MKDSTGKIAVVTGASRGIGREITIRLVESGAKVVAIGRSRATLLETQQLAKYPENVRIFEADLRSKRDIEQIVSFVHQELGSIDILMNIAGVWHNGGKKYQGPEVAETDTDEILEVMDVGLRGGFILTRSFLPDLIQKRRGKVVFISCGFAGPHEAVGWVHYYVTNKAIDALTAGLAAELRQHEIQVNAIAPWFVATDAVRHFYQDEVQGALDPEYVADMAIFLASSEADHISGQIIELRSKNDRRP